MKKEFEKEQKDNQIDDAFLDMPDIDDDEKFSRWLEDEYLKEADAIEESLFAGRKFEDNQDIAEKLSVSRESFYQRMREEGMLDEETEESAADRSEEENSNGTVEMPAGEDLEKNVLEFRKNPETAQEDIGSAEKVLNEVINGDVKIVIKELNDENDQQTTYIATWAIGECTYSWIGKMQVDELKKIVKEMKF